MTYRNVTGVQLSLIGVEATGIKTVSGAGNTVELVMPEQGIRAGRRLRGGTPPKEQVKLIVTYEST